MKDRASNHIVPLCTADPLVSSRSDVSHPMAMLIATLSHSTLCNHERERVTMLL
jgi:hypothetical protein